MKRIISIILMIIMIFPFYIFSNISYAAGSAGIYTVTTEAYSSASSFKSGNGNKYNGEEITDVKLVNTEYKYYITTKSLKNGTIYYKGENFRTREDGAEFIKRNFKNGGTYNGYTITGADCRHLGYNTDKPYRVIFYVKYYEENTDISNWTTKNAADYFGATIMSKSKVTRTYKRYTYKVTTKKNIPNNNGGSTGSSTGSPSGSSTGSSSGSSTGGSSSSSTGGSSVNTSTPTTSYVDNIEVGDTLKFTGYAWHTKSSDGGDSTGKFLSNGDLIKVIQKGETTNYLKVEVLSGKLLDTSTYILYGSEASQYFEKVESVEVNDTTNSEDEKQTETIDKGTATENAIAFAKLMYKGILGKDEEEANSYITADSSIVKDFESGKITAAEFIKYLNDLEKPYENLSFDDYCKHMYKSILQKDITDSELIALKEQYGEDENFQSEILGNIINSNEFKALCEKYSINVGTYTVSEYNSNITKEKATTFVKNLYSTLMNKTATDDEITKIVKNITDGKITASGIYKAFFESDEFKNQKVSDDKYVEMLGKVCWNKDLTEEQNKEYTNKLINGTTRNELLKEFILATDCTALCDEYGISKGNYEAGKLRSTDALATDFVKNVHNATLGESSKVTSTSSTGLITGSLSAADVIQLYVESSNFENRIKSENLTNSDYIKCLFNACLQRDASSTDEAKQYENKIDQSYKPSVLAEFFKLDEYKKLCNSYYLVAGSYTDNKENNQNEPKTTNYGSGGAKITTKERTLSNGKTVKYTTKVEFDISAGLKGDLDGDNHVGIEDATLLLSYVATQELNYIKPTDEVLKMADVDGDKEITVEDAQYILQYYAMNAAQLNPTWEEAIEAAKKYDEDGTIPTKDTSTTEDKENTNNNNSETVDSKNFCVDITKSNSMPVCNEEQLTKMINNSDVTQEAKNNMLSVVSDLVKYQNEYKVNAVFFMAVTKTDSKWGTEWKNIDSKTHNWTGLLGTKGGGYTGSDGRTFNSYSSYSEATKDWFELISDADGYYFGSQKYTVDDIAQTYANAQWGQVVSENIQKLYSLISNENIATDNKGFAKVASERKKYIADNGYIYGHEDPRTTKQVNSVSYISWALLDYGYNATSNGVLINDVSGLRSWLSKSGFKQTYNGKTLSTNEAGLQAGDIVIEGVENGQYTHTQIYAGKNESGQDIWYSAGNNKSIATQPGKDNFSNPYESDHYIVEVYREESKGNYVDTSKTENNYKTNGKDETEKTGIEGIFSVGDKKYNIYCQSKGSWSNRPYWDGTVATDGDAPTCIAIIGSGYGKNITPADVATQCETAAGLKVGEVNPGTGLGSYQNVTNAFKHYGIKVSEYTEDIDYNKIKNHLMQKKTIMLNVSGNYGPRSTSGHYITILGYDESQDKVFIGDTVSNCSGWWSTETVLSKAKYIWYVDE